MSALPRRSRDVIRYFYALLTILSLSAAALITSISMRYGVAEQHRNQLERAHLRNLMLINEATQRLSDLDRHLDAEWGRTDSPPTPSRKATLALLAVGRALDSLSTLELSDADRPLRQSVERARRQHERLRASLEEGEPGVAAWRQRRQALDFALFQLYRLHSIRIESLVRDIGIREQRGRRNLALAAGVILMATGLLVRRILSLLRQGLRRQEDMEKELVERERQLQQASKMEALGTLVGGVAHDFNNLLTAILGRCDTLEMQLKEGDPAHRELQEIRKAGDRAASLTRQLLTFSRQEQIEPEVLDLNLLLQGTQPLLRRLLPEDISVNLDCGSGLCKVQVDRVQIEQVIVNLAVNARDAMPNGGCLTLRTTEERVRANDEASPAVPAGRYARLTVEDNGSGIHAELRDRIFEPFFTTKERGKGTGLGLSTVHGIVRRSNGYITVESETGRGTRFDVYLPEARGSMSPSRSMGSPSKMAVGRGTVLLAEDVEQVRELAATALRQAGYRVLPAQTGDEALDICKTHEGPIDLILTDVVMPGLRGPALVERALVHPHARVVYMSGYTEDAILNGTTDADAPLVTKPFNLRQLLEVVASELELLERRANSA